MLIGCRFLLQGWIRLRYISKQIGAKSTKNCTAMNKLFPNKYLSQGEWDHGSSALACAASRSSGFRRGLAGRRVYYAVSYAHPQLHTSCVYTMYSFELCNGYLRRDTRKIRPSDARQRTKSRGYPTVPSHIFRKVHFKLSSTVVQVETARICQI